MVSEMWLSKTCMLCGEHSQIKLTDKETEKYLAYKHEDYLIQELFPRHSAAVREFLKSGMCNDCMKKMFGQTSKRIKVVHN